MIRFYSPDTTKCLIVRTEGDTRYIYNGDEIKYILDTNYVKLDISKIAKLGQCIYVCWDDEGYDWQAIVDGAEIIESKLDTNKFKVKTQLPLNERGTPTEIKFRGENCAIYSYYSNSLSPDNNGAIIK
ncbi:hypothetical protein [Chondrinema litorale]|uniref:hypothetical protein n=1 Tax=Chondrinema litorale TaxID=2994555 RepID=UPI002543A802|nr:hypothetical protein [Chondrinema litorale]UZR97146.1 hypothetical protein OQ292_23905 [Chondrinema litorale]